MDAVEISGIGYEIGAVIPSVVLGVIGLIDQGELDWKVLCINQRIFEEMKTTKAEFLNKSKNLIDYVINFFVTGKTFEFKKVNRLLKGKEF